MADIALECDSDILRKQDGILFLLAPFDQRFQDGAQVAYRHFFGNKALQDFGNLLHRHDAQALLDQIGKSFFHGRKQKPGFLDADEIG
ncbi:Uncharacterised protein [Bordetella pertussis]|nr:Uncharacterised protein [Bordetella pertussis]CPH97846.1 Uncharacterised protein [Bordetella pertussis]CPK63616.1 Uncharacterised protein [Bordetella pertussis]CPL74914.1 Uncharacterised protein [Bordetella pertussis]CPN47796.1 Uncharacterised protein [Bordetella pertussis]